MGASDPNAMFREVIKRNVEVEHLRGTMMEQTLEKECIFHKNCGGCTLEPCDLCVFGTPCNPFSEQRTKRYRDNSVVTRPLAEVTFRDAKQMVLKGQRKCLIMEQVAGFDKPEQAGETLTPLRRPYHTFCSLQSAFMFSCTCG